MYNNMLLGPIPGNGGGLRKTYEESILFNNVDRYLIESVMQNYPNKQKLYISKEGVLSNNNFDDSKEVEIIGFYPYLIDSDSVRYAIEVIDKEVLHEHLVSEYEYKNKLLSEHKLERKLTK